jgi:hypothetical protein
MSQLKIYLPPPANWQDFQVLVKDIAVIRYKPTSVIEYGSPGQRQNGVDVFAKDFSDGRIGIQCKETKNALTGATVRDEADKATAFPAGLDHFIVATTDSTDTKVQLAVIELNKSKSYPFSVSVEFWNDLVNDINRYALVLNSCYERYKTEFQKSDEVGHLACLRVAFDRPAFQDDFQHERNYPDFEEALASTKRLFRTGITRDRWSQIPVVHTIPVESLPEGPYRMFVSKIERHVDKIYKSYLSDRQRIQSDRRYAQDRAGHYNEL